MRRLARRPEVAVRQLARSCSASPSPVRHNVALYDLGVVPYNQAWDWQRAYVGKRLQDVTEGREPTLGDALMVLEHESVFTLGRASKTANVLADLQSPPPGMPPVVRVERGGEVTYHGPGQLVLYPLLCLDNFKKDLRWYVQGMEEVVITALKHYGIDGHRADGAPGVWVDNKVKVAAIGMTAKRWHTMHGLSWNVCVDLDPYKYIIPCGIKDKGVTSMVKLKNDPSISVDDAKDVLLKSFCTVFDVDFTEPTIGFDEVLAMTNSGE